MPKYLKVMFGTTSGANSDVKYKFNENLRILKSFYMN